MEKTHCAPPNPPFVVIVPARQVSWLADQRSGWPSQKHAFSGVFSRAFRLQLRGQRRFLTGFPLSFRRESKEPKQQHIGCPFK